MKMNLKVVFFIFAGFAVIIGFLTASSRLSQPYYADLRQIAFQLNPTLEQMVKTLITYQAIDNIAQQNNQQLGDLANKLDDTRINIDIVQSVPI